MWKIPLFATDFGEAELEAVRKPVKDGWLTMGPITSELESHFSSMLGVKHSIAVTNCTCALHLALLSQGVGHGDEVIGPAMTFIASVNAARYCGAKVVFADIIGEEDLTLDPDDVKRKITPRTKAIVVVHYAGFPAQMEALSEIAREYGLSVVEDSAHSLITTVNGKALGSIGAAGCFSFFSNKNITCGEGGMVTTNDDKIAEKVRLLRSHGMTSLTLDRHEGRAWSYDCVATGWNFRIDEIRASLALAQLKRLPEFLEKRVKVRKWYLEALEASPVTVPFRHWDRRESKDARIGYHIMPVVLPTYTDRLFVMSELKSKGIQSSIHYPPAHLFSMAAAENHPRLPVTEDIAARELTLPFYPGMSQEDVREVCTHLLDAVSRR